MNNGDKTTVVNNGDSSASGVSAEPEYVVPEVLPMDDEENPKHKIKGAAQIAAGTALTAAGVPMLVLPGPGAVAIAGGAALISKGQRNCSGRSATPFEEKLDDAAEKAAVAVKALSLIHIFGGVPQCLPVCIYREGMCLKSHYLSIRADPNRQ